MEAELRQELARLQEREAELTRLLQLERERRVRAEQDSEIEKQACLELGQLLSREKQLRQTCPTSPSQMTLVPFCLKEEEEEVEEEEVEGGAKLYPAISPHTNTDSKVRSAVPVTFSLPLCLVLVSKSNCFINTLTGIPWLLEFPCCIKGSSSLGLLCVEVQNAYAINTSL